MADMPSKFIKPQKRSALFKSLKYRTAARVLTFFGDIRYNGNMNFRIHANDIFRAEELLKPGDIILTRTDKTFSELAIPGFWSHAALYVGGAFMSPDKIISSGMVIEATSDGVVFHHLFDCLGHADHFCVLRPPAELMNPDILAEIITRALSIVEKPYDFFFIDGEDSAFFCSEVVTFAYRFVPGITFQSSDGRRVSPEDLYYNPQLILIHENTKDGVK